MLTSVNIQQHWNVMREHTFQLLNVQRIFQFYHWEQNRSRLHWIQWQVFTTLSCHLLDRMIHYRQVFFFSQNKKMNNHWLWLQDHVIPLKNESYIYVSSYFTLRAAESWSACVLQFWIKVSCWAAVKAQTASSQTHKPSQHFNIIFCRESSIIILLLL